ncbi:hypothetical protein ACET3Z_014698 [Daucus carota]
MRFHGLIPHMYRKGHYLVVEGLARPIKGNKFSNAAAKTIGARYHYELYLSATEVLAQPDHVVTALQRNYTILAVKQIYSKDNDKILATTNRLISFCGGIGISTPVDELSKYESKRTVFNLDSAKHSSKITQVVLIMLDEFEDLPKLLGEGHSIFIKGLTNVPLNSIKFDGTNKIWSGEWNEDNWPTKVNRKTKQMGSVMLAEAIAKDDKRYMPREAAATAIERNNSG